MGNKNESNGIKAYLESQEKLSKMLETPTVFKLAQENLIRVQKMINPLRDIIERQDKIRKSFESPLKKILEQQERFRKILEPFSTLIKKAATDFDYQKNLLLSLGFPPHYDLELPDMREIADYYREHGEEAAKLFIEDKLLSTFSDNQIEQYLNRWLQIEWMKARHPILNEAIQCHIEGKYFSAIATLLPQLEGVLIDGTDNTGFIKQERLKQLMESVLNEEGTFSFDDKVRLFYIEKVLASFKHGDVINSPLSRHAILHGGDTNYGYKINSLRCILLFDYLVYRMEENE